MQTFLPYPDFTETMNCLDNQRLGNQVYREALTLVRGGWPNHPASKMWRGYEHALCNYALAGLDELKRRGKYYPHHYKTFISLMHTFEDTGMPWWLGMEDLHSSHRSALLFKNRLWYRKYGWKENPATPNMKGSLPYVWPV